jgi:hypothetical protein
MTGRMGDTFAHFRTMTEGYVQNGRERRHTEVGAPAKQDLKFLVLRNTSRRPGTETSNPVFGPVVTALPRTIPQNHPTFSLAPEADRGAAD